MLSRETKHAIVIPVYKLGIKRNAFNNRPIRTMLTSKMFFKTNLREYHFIIKLINVKSNVGLFVNILLQMLYSILKNSIFLS